MFTKNGSRNVAILFCLLAFGCLFWAMVPGPTGVQVGVFGLFALLIALAFFSIPAALSLFAFLIPLLGIVSRVCGSPWISMLVFAFLGLVCGAVLRARVSGRELSGSRMPMKTSLLAFAGLVIASGLITTLRFMNFFPFTGEPFHDWTVNSTGVLTTEAVNNAVTVGVAYVSGIALLLLVYSLLSGSCGSRRLRIQKNVAWAVVIAGLAANLFALWQVVSDRLLVIGFVTGTYTDSNALGVCNALILPYSIGLILVSSSRSRVFLVVCSLLSVAVTVLARSRAGVVGVILFLLALALWLRRLDRESHRQRAVPRRALRAFAALGVLLIVMLVLQDVSHLSEVPVFGDVLLMIVGPSEAPVKNLLQHRVHQWSEALRMCRDFPWTGVGLGAYIIELPNYYFRSEGKLFMIDTAGSLPLQIASELGILGLVLALTLAVFVIRSSYRLLSTRPEARLEAEHKLSGCISLGVLASLFSLLFGAHVLFFEYCFLFAISTGILLAWSAVLRPQSQRFARGRRVPKPVWLFAPVVTLVSVVFLIESLGALSIEQRRRKLGWQFEYGFYRKETWDGEFPFWWMQRDARMTITAEGEVLEFALFCAHPDADEKPVKASIFIDGSRMKTVELTRDRWRKVLLKLNCRPGGQVVLRITVDRAFNQRELGIAQDARDLGAAIAKVRWSNACQ